VRVVGVFVVLCDSQKKIISVLLAYILILLLQ